jgi:hypothetical protein
MTYERGVMFDGSQDGILGKWTFAKASAAAAAESYENVKNEQKRERER